MCGRYSVTPEGGGDEIARVLAALNRRGEAVKTGEIRPTDTAAVLAPTGAAAMRWGMARPGGGVVINARAETMAQRPMFRRAARCVVPASHYFEWDARRTRYEISLPGESLYMAGLWRVEDGVPAFVVVTRDAAPALYAIHNRMPLLLPRAACETWLSGASADAIPAREDVRAFAPVRQLSLFDE